MKHLPNLLSALRIALALWLFWIIPLSTLFYVIYLLCGLTDVLDGWLARRLKAQSLLGAQMDSAADFLVAAALIWRLLPVVWPGAAVAAWVAFIAFLRLGAAAVARLRFGQWGFLHTVGNKLTGALLFCYPLSLKLTQAPLVLYILCTVATLTAAEELLIELTAQHWDADLRSLWQRRGAGKN